MEARGAPADDGEGIHRLSTHVLAFILKAVHDKDSFKFRPGGPWVAAPELNPLLPLRGVSRAFREAVDAVVEGLGCSVRSRNIRDGPQLLSVVDSLQRTRLLWPHQRAMWLQFDWHSDDLRIALWALAASRPSLQTLSLNAAFMREEDDGSNCLEALATMRELKTLTLWGFGVHPGWWEDISAISSLESLDLYKPGAGVRSILPNVKRLKIEELHMWQRVRTVGVLEQRISRERQGPPHILPVEHPNSQGSTVLRSGCPGGSRYTRVGSLLVPLTVEELVLTSAHLGDILSLRLELPRLRTLELEDVPMQGTLALDLCPGLEDVALVHLPGLTAISGLESLTGLKHLKLEALHLVRSVSLDSSEEGGVSRCSSLEMLEISRLEALERLPRLASLTRLQELVLCELDMAESESVFQLPPSLECLDMSRCPNLHRPDNLSDLTRLEALLLTFLMEERPLPDLSRLTALVHLRLVDCSSNESTELPPFGPLKNVRRLTLEGMRGLTAIPSLAELTSLTSLSIGPCPGVTSVPLGQHPRLKKVLLKNLALETFSPAGLSCPLVSLAIGDCERLTTVDLCGSPIADNEKSLELFDCPNVETIMGSKLDLKSAGCRELRYVLRSRRNPF